MHITYRLYKSLRISLILIVAVVCSSCQSAKSSFSELREDFYESVNSKWLKEATLPDGAASYTAFDEVVSKTNQKVYKIMDQIMKEPNKERLTKSERNLETFCMNFLNLDMRNQQNIEPIKETLDEIRGVKTTKQLNKVLTNPDINCLTQLVSFDLFIDSKNLVNVLSCYMPQLTLGDASFYEEENELGKAMQEAYNHFFVRLFTMSGTTEDEAIIKAKHVLEMEKIIAQDSNRATREYVYTREELDYLVPELKLPELLDRIGYQNVEKVTVINLDYLLKLNNLYQKEDIDVFRDYIEGMFLKEASSYLSEAFDEAYTTFNNQIYGIESVHTLEDKAKACMEKYFQKEIDELYINKGNIQEPADDLKLMAEDLIVIYKQRIIDAEWMSEQTKQYAIEKLENITINIGYPENWGVENSIELKSYENRGSLIRNILDIKQAKRLSQREKIGKPLDPKQWDFSIRLPNAYYNYTTNSMFIPIGILEEPFYSNSQSYEKNLGGIGTIIAHEISHSFDEIGAAYDKDGRFRNWWTTEDQNKFRKKLQQVKSLYNNIEIEPEQFIDGGRTANENFADLLGIESCLELLQSQKQVNYRLFFENYAATYRCIFTKAYEDYLLNYDFHAPAKYRINTVLSQFDEFYQTYHVKETDGMYIAEESRLEIW